MTIASILTAKLADPKLLTAGSYLAGEWRQTSTTTDTFTVTNPANGALLATLPDMSSFETRQAIDSAKQAQPAWAALTGIERGNILRKWYELVHAHIDDLAIILTAEMGKPLAESRAELAYGSSFLQWFAEESKRIYGDIIPGHQRDKRLMVWKQPVGVFGAITPWNFPAAMITRKVAPGLAVGCAGVVKPAAETPLSAIALASLAERAGVPAGIFNIITSRKSAEIGKELCNNPQVSKLTFTGSTEVGRILAAQCAPQIKKLSLELGGHAPFIVFADADIDAAVQGAVIAKYRNAGQTCVCANRIYVHDQVYDDFSEKLIAKTNQLRVGDGFSPDSEVGPLINMPALEKVVEHIEDARSKGATVGCGGAAVTAGELFFQPTVLLEVKQQMQIAQEETFGPVAPLLRFNSVDQVINQANDTKFGLAAYFYGRDLNLVWRVAEELEYGMVGVNTGIISTELAPFGGVKQSGIGREGSKYGVDEFLNIKYVCLGGINSGVNSSQS